MLKIFVYVKIAICRVFRVKFDTSHLNKAQILRLKMLLVEAKCIYNFDTKILTVHTLDKDYNLVTHEL